MEKVIVIDGKNVRLKSNALLPLIFKSNFDRDIFEVQSQVFGLGREGLNIRQMRDIECLGLQQVIWAMAKAADKSIAPFEEWLGGFDEFPIFDFFNDILDLFLVNISSSTKIKNAGAAEG